MKRVPLLIVLAMTTLYAVYFSWFTVMRHHKLNSSRFDLGNMEQAVWSTVHGNILHMTDPYGTAAVKRLAFHGDVLLLGLAPVYALWSRAEMLLVVQSLALAAGAIAVWLIARHVFRREWLSVILAGSYLLYPGLQWTNIFDFHPVALSIPLILWGAWLALNKRYRLTLLLVMLAAMAKEEIGFMLPAIGIFVWSSTPRLGLEEWRQHQPRWGILLAVLPLVWSLMMTFVTIPSWQAVAAINPPTYHSLLGDSGSEIVKNALSHPSQLISILFSRATLAYVWPLLAPLGFFPVLGLWSIAASPEIVINLISTKPAQLLIFSHYTAGMTPWFVLGTIWAIAWMLKRWARRTWLPVAVGAWLMGFAAFGAYAYGPLPGARFDHSRFATWRNEYAAPVRDWAQRIPSTAAVSVTNNIGAQFAKRFELYSFPLGVDQADYVIVLEGHATPVVATQEDVSASISQLRTDATWSVLFHDGDLTVLQRKR